MSLLKCTNGDNRNVYIPIGQVLMFGPTSEIDIDAEPKDFPAWLYMVNKEKIYIKESVEDIKEQFKYLEGRPSSDE